MQLWISTFIISIMYLIVSSLHVSLITFNLFISKNTVTSLRSLVHDIPVTLGETRQFLQPLTNLLAARTQMSFAQRLNTCSYRDYELKKPQRLTVQSYHQQNNTTVFISLTDRESPLNLICGLRFLLSLAVYTEACCRLTAAVSELVLLLGGLAVENISKASFAKRCNSGKLLLANTSNDLRECWPPATAIGAEEPII